MEWFKGMNKVILLELFSSLLFCMHTVELKSKTSRATHFFDIGLIFTESGLSGVTI